MFSMAMFHSVKCPLLQCACWSRHWKIAFSTCRYVQLLNGGMGEAFVHIDSCMLSLIVMVHYLFSFCLEPFVNRHIIFICARLKCSSLAILCLSLAPAKNIIGHYQFVGIDWWYFLVLARWHIHNIIHSLSMAMATMAWRTRRRKSSRLKSSTLLTRWGQGGKRVPR